MAPTGSAHEGDVLTSDTGALARALVHADRALLLAGHGRLLEVATRSADLVQGVGPASLVTAGNLRAKLRYVYGRTGEDRFLFGLIGGDEFAVELANVRLDVSVAPSSEPLTAAMGPATLLAAVPDFLETRAGIDGIAVRLASGEILHVPNHDLRSDDRWPRDRLVEVLLALADWQREVNSGPLHRMQPKTGGHLDHLLIEVLRCFAVLHGDLAAAQETVRTPAGLGGALLSRYGAGYGFSQMRAKVLVNLDADGEIVLDGDAGDRQQIDIALELLPGSDPAEIKADLRIPDLLVDGAKYHRAFAKILVDGRAAEALFGARLRPYFANEADFAAFLRRESVQESAVFARVDRNDADVDLVYLKGDTEGGPLDLLLRLVLKVREFPDVVVDKVEHGRLIATRRPDARWIKEGGGEREELTRYLQRILLILKDWQSRIERP